jgi:hypothetical protein
MVHILALEGGQKKSRINAIAPRRLLTHYLYRARDRSNEAYFASADLARFRQQKCFGFPYTRHRNRLCGSHILIC